MDMETKEGMIEYCKKVADINKWIFNQDKTTFEDLIEGLLENKKTLGYQSCPCRLASGNRELDRDLICPCDYAQQDVPEMGVCYCNLYMRENYYETINKEFYYIPERRPEEKDRAVQEYFKQQE